MESYCSNNTIVSSPALEYIPPFYPFSFTHLYPLKRICIVWICKMILSECWIVNNVSFLFHHILNRAWQNNQFHSQRMDNILHKSLCIPFPFLFLTLLIILLLLFHDAHILHYYAQAHYPHSYFCLTLVFYTDLAGLCFHCASNTTSMSTCCPWTNSNTDISCRVANKKLYTVYRVYFLKKKRKKSLYNPPASVKILKLRLGYCKQRHLQHWQVISHYRADTWLKQA